MRMLPQSSQLGSGPRPVHLGSAREGLSESLADGKPDQVGAARKAELLGHPLLDQASGMRERAAVPRRSSGRQPNRPSPAFTSQAWTRCVVKTITRGRSVWEYKATRVHLTDSSNPDHTIAVPNDGMYWLLAARNTRTDEVTYAVSSASEQTPPESPLLPPTRSNLSPAVAVIVMQVRNTRLPITA